MNVLLLCNSLNTGGVETLIVRMANWLVNNGHECSVLLRTSFEGDLIHLLNPSVKVAVVGNRWDLLAVPVLRRIIWNSWKLPKPDIIYTVAQSWGIVSILIRDLFSCQRTAIATGAYHINQFATDGIPRKWGRLTLFQKEIYNHYFLDSQKIFMSEETRAGHESFFNRSMSDGWIWPLPIEIPNEKSRATWAPTTHRIISIGRLTQFKTYSWYMVPILYELREKYPDVQWHVYGHGPCERELVDEVWKYAISEGLIVFHGTVPYNEMTRVLEHADVFIGMGTALLEAAAFGIPSIPALIDDNTASTWGFINKMPYYTTGETIPGMQPLENVKEILVQLFESTNREKKAISLAGREYAQVYAIDYLMCKFIDYCAKLDGGVKLPARIKIRYIFIRSLKLLRNFQLSFYRAWKRSPRHLNDGERELL